MVVHPIGDPHGSPHKGELIVLDRGRLQVIKRIPVGQEPRSVAVNPVTNKIYVVNYGPTSYSVSVIDGATLTVVKTISTGQAPIDVAVNSRTLLPPITVGPGATGLAVDEATNTIHIALSNWSFEPYVNALGSVFDNGTFTVVYPPVPIPDRTQPRAMAVDDTRIYVGNLGGGTQSLTTVRVMQQETPMWTISVGNGTGREFYVGNRLGDLLRLSHSSGTPVPG